MTFEGIIKRIDSLPPLSNAANLIQTMYESGIDNINIIRLVRVIESDAMLAANILKMINAPFYGFSNKITSIAQAVSLFGTKRIQVLVVQYAMSQNIKADTSVYGFAHSQFNELCHLQSALMLQWYSNVEIRDAQFLASLALIMESGKLILAKEVADSDYVGEFRRGFNECSNIEEYEDLVIDTTSYNLSALLFEHWHLDSVYIEIMKNLNASDEELQKLDPKSRSYINQIDVIRTAINAKEILTDSSIELASKKVAKMGHSSAIFKRVALRIRNAYFKSH